MTVGSAAAHAVVLGLICRLVMRPPIAPATPIDFVLWRVPAVTVTKISTPVIVPPPLKSSPLAIPAPAPVRATRAVRRPQTSNRRQTASHPRAAHHAAGATNPSRA